MISKLNINKYCNRSYLMNHFTIGKVGINGIWGAHKKQSLYQLLRNNNGEILEPEIPVQQDKIAGITYVHYRVGYVQDYKTIYDQDVISDNTYIDRGIEAADYSLQNNHMLSLTWIGKDRQGVVWEGGCKNNTFITTFYPKS